MKKIFYFILFFCCYGCFHKETDCIRPYTKEEKSVITEFKNKGLDISLERFNYECDADNINTCGKYLTDTYTITINDVSDSLLKNTDSLRHKSREIASLFFKKIISDSIILYTSKIEISFQQFSTFSNTENPKDKFYDAVFKKEDLQNFTGFKVIEKNNKLVRKLIKNKSKNLFIFKEVILTD